MEFNLTRALNVAARKFFVNRKSFFIFAGIFFFISAAVHFLYASSKGFISGGERMQLNTVADVIAVIIAVGIYPFIELSEKKNSVLELLFPASRTEKFAVETFVAVLFIPVCVIICDILALYTGNALFKIYIMNRGFEYSLPDFTNIFRGFAKWEYADWMFMTGGVIISFLGAVFFKKFRVVKTWVIVGVIGFVIIIIASFAMYLNYKATGYWFPYSVTSNGHFNEVTGQMVYETAVYYKGQKLDYTPWFFNGTFWTVVATVFFLALFCCSWLRYKKERA